MSKNLASIFETITDADIRNLEGKFLTLIESLGLPEKQENAIKSQVKEVLWNKWAEVIDRLCISYNGTIYTLNDKGIWEATGGYASTKIE